jgi:hypothetical protein
MARARATRTDIAAELAKVSSKSKVIKPEKSTLQKKPRRNKRRVLGCDKRRYYITISRA